MQNLLNDLADLSALRDREELDFALVKLVRNAILNGQGTVRLVRTIGLPQDRRWLVRAHLGAGLDTPDCDHVWADWSALPPFANFPAREKTVAQGHMLAVEAVPPATTFTTLFPIDLQPSVCSLLEVETDQPLPNDVQPMVVTTLRIYQNLLGLLDYGERDALTDLLNRKSFDSAFVRAAVEHETNTEYDQPNRRSAASGGSFWLAMIDIDHFKRVNDNFGHLIGDEVLLLLARLMRATFRFHDQLYRFGGEEFVVLLRCVDHASTAAVLERFRHAVEAFTFPQTGTVTISVGFAGLRANDTPDVAFDRADKAVYYAKAHGRNQVCSFADLVSAGELTEQEDNTTEVSFF